MYISKHLFLECFNNLSGRTLTPLKIEKPVYNVLCDLRSSGYVLNDKEDVPNEEVLTIKFVVLFRTVYTNLIAVKNNYFCFEVSPTLEDIATIDDAVLLSGKSFIDTYIQTDDISAFIKNTVIQPLGGIYLDTINEIVIPIEIIVQDIALEEHLFSLNAVLVDMDSYNRSCNLLNGFNHIQEVRSFYEAKSSIGLPVIDNIVVKNLVVLKGGADNGDHNN